MTVGSAEDCRACANVPLLTDPDDERFLYCVLPAGHDGLHYDNGAEVSWRGGREEVTSDAR